VRSFSLATYDASVMGLVNTNKDCLHLMGAGSGSKRDSAAIGGLKTVNRHLEDLDLLFARESCLSWRVEKEFELLKSNGTGLVENIGADIRPKTEGA
jgi:hypothetical protein